MSADTNIEFTRWSGLEDQDTGSRNEIDMDSTDRLDRSPSNGSLSEEEVYNDEMAFKPNDGRSTTRTTFYAHDSSVNLTREQYKRYERLARLNDDQYSSERDQQNRDANKQRYAHTCSNRLNLCRYQRDRVLHIVDDIDFSKYNPAGLRYEEVIVCIISLVLYEDRGELFDGDIRDWFDTQYIIHDMLDAARSDKVNKMKMADFWTARRHLLRNTDHFDVEVIS